MTMETMGVAAASSSSSTASSSLPSGSTSSAFDSSYFGQLMPAMVRGPMYRFVQVKTAADSLPFLFNAVATSGKMSFVGVIVVYLVFVLLWLPFWLLSFVVMESGVYTIAVFTIFLLGRCIIRMIAFPGASSKVASEIETEFAKYSVRMLLSSCNCLMDLANSVISASNNNINNNNNNETTTPTKKKSNNGNTFAYYEIPGLWKRAKSYRDRAMGVYLDVLNHIYDPPVSQQLQQLSNSNSSSNSNNNDSDRTKFGMNKISGDIGNLSGLTLRAKTDGKELVKLLKKVLSQLENLEQQASAVLEASSGGGARTKGGGGGGAISDEARSTAKELLASASELRDFVTSLKSSGDGGGDDEEGENNDGSQYGGRNREMAEDAYETIKSGVNSILPMIDPPLHTSIFGLDVLRGCMISRYLGARQLWVRRPKGGMVDVIHIPAINSNLGDNNNHKNTKAVMYCNPNAGLIEVATGMGLAGGNVALDADDDQNSAGDNTWTTFYTELGYDIYLFNYSGFGRSYGTTSCVSGRPSDQVHVSGALGAIKRIFLSTFFAFKPTPETLRGDGLAVANYIVTEAGVQSLIIHGESLGGVAASATARCLSTSISAKDKMSLLVCDRTFCNLEAVAQRLVGGWSGYAIRALAPFWNTDIAGDFVATQCPKIVATDFADNIVSDPSSLKSGISLWREISRGVATTKDVGWIMETPLEYRMSEWENACVNDSKYLASAGSHPRRTPVPVWPTDKYVSLDEAFHFAACAKRIGKMAKQGFQYQQHQHSLQLEEENNNTQFSSNNNIGELPPSGAANHVQDAWMALAVCDGLCGAPLGATVKIGFDSTVAWLCACLTYGAQTVVDRAETRLSSSNNNEEIITRWNQTAALSDFDGRPEGYQRYESENEIHPKPIPEVIRILKSILVNEAGDRRVTAVAYELKYVVSILEYLVARISSASIQEAAWKCKNLKTTNTGETRVGCFLNLHCGHNNSFLPAEREKLKQLVEKVQFARASKSGSGGVIA